MVNQFTWLFGLKNWESFYLLAQTSRRICPGIHNPCTKSHFLSPLLHALFLSELPCGCSRLPSSQPPKGAFCFRLVPSLRLVRGCLFPAMNPPVAWPMEPRCLLRPHPTPLPLAHSVPATAASSLVLGPSCTCFPAPFTPPPLAHVSGSPGACPKSSPSPDTLPSCFVFFFTAPVLTSHYLNVLIALTFHCNRHGKAVRKGTLGSVFGGEGRRGSSHG